MRSGVTTSSSGKAAEVSTDCSDKHHLTLPWAVEVMTTSLLPSALAAEMMCETCDVWKGGMGALRWMIEPQGGFDVSSGDDNLRQCH